MEAVAAPKRSLAQKKVRHPYITRKEGVCGGEPIIADTRITVRLIAGWHKMDKNVAEMVAMYPHLNHAQVYDALSFYYDHKDEIEKSLAENREEVWMRKTSGEEWRR